MQYLLDTNTCVFFLRGKMDLDEAFRVKGVDNIYISEITVFELRFGAENSEDVKKSHEAVDRFIRRLSIIPIIGSVKKYAEVKVTLRRKGKPINDEFDLIIGITALENKLTLVTDNGNDFKDIDGLKIENWYKRK